VLSTQHRSPSESCAICLHRTVVLQGNCCLLVPFLLNVAIRDWHSAHIATMLPLLQEHGRLKEKSNLGVPPVSRVEMVQRTNLWGYQPGGPRPFLKITCALPNLVTSCRSEFGGGQGLDAWLG
jgi:hypothetical protein